MTVDNEPVNTPKPYLEKDERKGTVIFVNPAKGIRKTLVEDHILSEHEVSNYGIISKYCSDSSLDSGEFAYGSYCSIVDGEGKGAFILWRVQPDGRYYSDDDGFGAERQDEVELYAYTDDEGNNIGSFRIYSVGGMKYYGTGIEDEEAEYDKKRSALAASDHAPQADSDEIISFRIRKALNSLLAQMRSGAGEPKASFITEHSDYDCCLSVHIIKDGSRTDYHLSVEIYIEPHRRNSSSVSAGSRNSEKLFCKWLKNSDAVESVRQALRRLYY